MDLPLGFAVAVRDKGDDWMLSSALSPKISSATRFALSMSAARFAAVRDYCTAYELVACPPKGVLLD